MLQADTSAGTLEEQIREGFLDGLSFETDTQDRVKVFSQASEGSDWVRYTCPITSLQEFTPQVALSILLALWSQGHGLKVEVTQHLTGDWDQD